ncbi:tetratricopeptide repeat protein [Mycoplasmatota bacterium]|nr:tetratricopeptide repeat protein [Mycoplasmatota bacterium]
MDEAKIEELKKLIEDEDKQAMETLIEYYDEIDDFESLTKLYEIVLRKNPRDSKALNNLAVIYADFYKDYEKAKGYYEKTLMITPDEASVHYNYGVLLEFNFQEYEQAKEHYLKAIELDSIYVDAYINLSWLYLERLNDINTSYIVVTEALKYVEDSEIYTQIAYIDLKKNKEYQKAEENLHKAIELNDKNDLAFTYLGQLYVLEKRYDEARDIFNQALELGNLNELLIYEYGKLLITQYNDLDKTIDLLNKAIEVFPDDVVYYAYLANIYLVLGNHSEAKKYLHSAEEFEITSQEVLLMVGYLKVMLDEDKDEALMYFEKVIELDPSNLNALSFIGLYNLMNNKHIDTALNYFKKVAELSKDHFIIHFIIAQIYLKHYHDSTKALEYLFKIETNSLKETELSHLYLVIGNIYEKYENNNYQALDYYEKAYQAKPSKYLEEIINQLYENDKTIVN